MLNLLIATVLLLSSNSFGDIAEMKKPTTDCPYLVDVLVKEGLAATYKGQIEFDHRGVVPAFNQGTSGDKKFYSYSKRFKSRPVKKDKVDTQTKVFYWPNGGVGETRKTIAIDQDSKITRIILDDVCRKPEIVVKDGVQYDRDRCPTYANRDSKSDLAICKDFGFEIEEKVPKQKGSGAGEPEQAR